jgi:hypothetical protein
MDDTAVNAKLRRLVLKKYRLLAMKARLEAEMHSSETIETPAAFSASARDPEIKAILERQRAELRARRASLATEESVLRKQIAGLEESIRGYEAQVQSTKDDARTVVPLAVRATVVVMSERLPPAAAASTAEIIVGSSGASAMISQS